MQIHDAESRELTEEIFLMDRVCRVVTTLGKELRDNSVIASGGMIDKSVIELPTTEVAPFAVHLKEGGLMIFWALSETER